MDNPVNQKMTALFLTKAGYCTETADNGLEAFNIYAGSPLKFDLIFMDINMPDMDGFEATRRIRQEEKNMGVNRRVPIIALTANVLEEFENKCLKAGMDAFLAKPVKREDVFRAVKTWAVSS
ncbi:MAG: response regulator [Desulfobacteraceae bacterium]